MPTPKSASIYDRLISDPFGPSPEGAPATEPAAPESPEAAPANDPAVPESPGADPDSDPTDAETAVDDAPTALYMTDPGWERYGVLRLSGAAYDEMLDHALCEGTTYRVPLPAVVAYAGLPRLTNSLGEPLMWMPARYLRAAAREVGWYPTVMIIAPRGVGGRLYDLFTFMGLDRLPGTFRIILFLTVGPAVDLDHRRDVGPRCRQDDEHHVRDRSSGARPSLG